MSEYCYRVTISYTASTFQESPEEAALVIAQAHYHPESVVDIIDNPTPDHHEFHCVRPRDGAGVLVTVMKRDT